MYPNQNQDPGQQPQQPYQPPQQPPQPFPQQSFPPQQQPYQPQPYAQPQAQSPLDYLNQIAPQGPVKKPMFKGIRGLIIVGLIAVVIVSILAITLNVVNGQRGVPAQQMAARMVSTGEIADKARQGLKSTELRSLNSSLRIILTNATRESAAPLSVINVDIAKLDSSVTAKDAARVEQITARLEDARLNAVYDRTYAREMAYEVATLMTLLQQVYSQTSSNSLKTFLESTYNNLEPTQKALAEYNNEEA